MVVPTPLSMATVMVEHPERTIFPCRQVADLGQRLDEGWRIGIVLECFTSSDLEAPCSWLGQFSLQTVALLAKAIDLAQHALQQRLGGCGRYPSPLEQQDFSSLPPSLEARIFLATTRRCKVGSRFPSSA